MATREELYTALRNADAAGDSAGAAKLATYIQSLPAETAKKSAATPPPESGLERVAKGYANYMGSAIEPAAHLASSAIAAPLSGLAGIAAAASKKMGLTTTEPENVIESVGNALTYQPRTDAGKSVDQVVTTPLRKLAEAGDYVGKGLADTAVGADNVVRRPDRANIPRRMEGSPAAGAIANTAIQALPSLLLKGRANPAEVSGDGVRTSGVGGDVVAGEKPSAPGAAAPAERPSGLAAVPGKAPTKEQLKTDSRAAYKRAKGVGADIQPESFEAAKQSIGSMLVEEGLDPTLHPSTTAALKRIMDTKGTVSLQQLETLRRIAQDAESSIAPADKRLAGKTVDALDDFAESLTEKDLSSGSTESVAALKEARNLWSRGRKADTLDELMSRAELSAPNFSASGMENAVRTEFRALAKNQRKMRMFTAEEQAAIRKVATGGGTENALRLLGKLAPTGNISTGISAGAGFLAGGPVGAFALPVVGAAARFGATRMTLGNAARANELVRRGPAQTAPTTHQQLAQALAAQRSKAP